MCWNDGRSLIVSTLPSQPCKYIATSILVSYRAERVDLIWNVCYFSILTQPTTTTYRTPVRQYHLWIWGQTTEHNSRKALYHHFCHLWCHHFGSLYCDFRSIHLRGTNQGNETISTQASTSYDRFIIPSIVCLPTRRSR